MFSIPGAPFFFCRVRIWRFAVSDGQDDLLFWSSPTSLSQSRRKRFQEVLEASEVAQALSLLRMESIVWPPRGRSSHVLSMGPSVQTGHDLAMKVRVNRMRETVKQVCCSFSVILRSRNWIRKVPFRERVVYGSLVPVKQVITCSISTRQPKLKVRLEGCCVLDATEIDGQG
jgi:hypothetical protein